MNFCLGVLKSAWKTDHLARILTCVSVCLIIASFVLPPTGVIDPSVLAAVGEIGIFIALLQFVDSINKGYETKIRIREMEMHIQAGKQEEETED